MKISIVALLAIQGVTAQLSKKPLRGGAKDLAEDEARVLEGRRLSMSMIQSPGEYQWDGKWPEETTTEATKAGDWSDWKGNSKASKSTSTKSSKSSDKDWWSPAPTVSNAPTDAKEWDGWWSGKSGKSSGGKSTKPSGKAGKSSGSWESGKGKQCGPADIEGVYQCKLTCSLIIYPGMLYFLPMC